MSDESVATATVAATALAAAGTTPAAATTAALTAIASSDTRPRLSIVMLMLLSERVLITGRGSCATRRARAASCLA